eukprot:UN03950
MYLRKYFPLFHITPYLTHRLPRMFATSSNLETSFEESTKSTSTERRWRKSQTQFRVSRTRISTVKLKERYNHSLVTRILSFPGRSIPR